MSSADQGGEPTVQRNSQQWAGMDGAVAWHLIERHADNWSDVRLMMDEWLKANTPGRDMQPVPCEQCAGEPGGWVPPWPINCGLSWSGHNVSGDEASIAAVRTALHAVHRAEQLSDLLADAYKKLAARPAAPQPAAGADEQDARQSQDSLVREPVWQALIYVLWNHQGRSSMIGQPIRSVLMLGPSERMPDWMVDIAHQVARAIGDPMAPPTPAADGPKPAAPIAIDAAIAAQEKP